MNMVRIRQIIALRKALKAGPLLPPISKSRENPSSCDGLSSNKASAKDILEINLRISELKTDLFAFDDIICLISVNENSFESSWKIVTTTEIIPKTDAISILNVFSVEYTFKRDQHLKIEICDCSEEEVRIVGMMTFFVTEIVTTTPNLSKPLIEIKSGKSIAMMTISYTAQPKEQTILLQFCGKNFPRKGFENTQIYFQMFRMEENETRNLLYTSDSQLYSSKILWKPFKLPKNTVTDSKKRNFEVVCYSRDDHTKCSIIGQFITTSDVLFKNAEERKILYLRVGMENNKKANGIIEVVKCNEITIYSFLDYIINGSQNYAAFGFGARIPPYFRKSQQFCLNLEMDPNCQGIDGLIDAFWKANAQVQPSTTAHFAHIIYHLSKLASNVRRRENQLQCPYFVLAIISKGKINDIRETVQATIFASKAPLSIIFIATEGDCSEMERLGLSAGRISYQNRRAQRDMLQFVALTKFRNKLPEDNNFWELLTERALRRVPWQMINWMMKNGHIPQDMKHYDCLLNQSTGTSELELDHRQERINAFSDPSTEDFDEREHASTSKEYYSHAETEDFSTTSPTPSLTS
uniref:BMA-CPNA-4 n=1 Tax=Brugia malayi TaxID=6279 RepID=A0A0H5S5G1_BRUMA|nr:BMA-CPNA-4 [Brugia malayi]